MRADAGSATVWWVTLCALLWFLTFAVLMAASVRIDRDRAATAADLAALAAAARAAQGTDHACARARAIAEANRAALHTCDLDGPVAEVSVSVPSSVLDRSIVARARAGPAHVVPPSG
ncbi:Rv3654c family TadE-like protein [Nocardiopsis aegyptia]|uniref:Secretion/DNA translocation related TadE-like protein n=1 Tax=Nocardiopsis aegyptia TaxID=220378 RepID=A0A7Z0ENK0_9ACTN|nr:Rv3654c family TadE-like protein [Nocardiopsis aegyptia]NYJ35422.1 secretion/DNA translocation related TadE-like protein [Nocardiopsis aegyptia]